jgi:predicted dehydrogenase
MKTTENFLSKLKRELKFLNKLNVAIVGCGYWGGHLLRNFYQSEYWNLVAACDVDSNQLNKVSQLYPDVTTASDYSEILNNNDINAIVISTPVASHYNLAKSALESGKNIWLEKPLTSSVEEANELINIANSKNLRINVDHTFIYTPAIQKIKQLINSGDLGEIIYFDSMRVNLGLFQHDVNVLWDLAPHDISILNYLMSSTPISVNATGKSLFKYGEKKIENIAYLTINYSENCIAHINVNWASPVKIRQMIIAGTKKMVVFDDMLQSDKLKIYDRGIDLKSREDIYEVLVQYRSGDMYSPALSTKEALKEEVDLFYKAILEESDTITSGVSGLDVIKILEAADKSLHNNGAEVFL